LGELPFYGLPAILVPYPFAWRYQKVNADYLVNKGAAVMIENSQLKEELIPALHRLLSDQHKMDSMRTEMASLARPDAAMKIAALVMGLVSPSLAEGKARA
jgi:UDP-N-acetylglucosamine--N-acetylmuramyl-(pentapeptide) pyrophosphoryl-undecaprenol N-acetylglucosamine transferase